jgi:hypothetical protein
MLTTGLKVGSALLCIAAIPAISGCANCRAGTRVTTVTSRCGIGGCKEKTAFVPKTPAKVTTQVALTSDLPPNARPGECYAKVFVPPEFATKTERVCVRAESERLEIVPAEFEWVDEKILVKEASSQLREIPAEFATEERVVQTSPGHTTWTKQTQARCVADNTYGPPPQDVFCLVSAPPATTTITTQRVSKPATVEEVTIPAEYQTVRRQKCVRPATTRRIPIPAEYRDIETTVMTSPGRMEWQRVDCDLPAHTEVFRMDTDVKRVKDVTIKTDVIKRDYNDRDLPDDDD